MPRKTKQTRDRWFPAIIACLVFIGLSIWVSALLPTEQPPADETARTPEQPVFITQTLKAWDGKLARFSGTDDLPAEVYDEVAIASLPSDVQQQLQNGIVVTSEEELLSLLDNFTS